VVAQVVVIAVEVIAVAVVAAVVAADDKAPSLYWKPNIKKILL
jgi:hypothetical protein